MLIRNERDFYVNTRPSSHGAKKKNLKTVLGRLSGLSILMGHGYRLTKTKLIFRFCQMNEVAFPPPNELPCSH